MTACCAKFCSNAICLSENARTSCRGIDDPQHVGGRGLLRDRFVSLGGAFRELPPEFGNVFSRIR